MLRFAASLYRSTFGSSSNTSSAKMTGPYIPEDWSIIEESPGGLELTFSNSKTGQATFYTPEGMTAREILAIPGAKKYWSTVQAAEKYIKKKAAEKERNGGEDYDTQK